MPIPRPDQSPAERGSSLAGLLIAIGVIGILLAGLAVFLPGQFGVRKSLNAAVTVQQFEFESREIVHEAMFKVLTTWVPDPADCAAGRPTCFCPSEAEVLEGLVQNFASASSATISSVSIPGAAAAPVDPTRECLPKFVKNDAGKPVGFKFCTSLKPVEKLRGAVERGDIKGDYKIKLINLLDGAPFTCDKFSTELLPRVPGVRIEYDLKWENSSGAHKEGRRHGVYHGKAN